MTLVCGLNAQVRFQRTLLSCSSGAHHAYIINYRTILLLHVFRWIASSKVSLTLRMYSRTIELQKGINTSTQILQSRQSDVYSWP
jgi:hypothetical protein